MKITDEITRLVTEEGYGSIQIIEMFAELKNSGAISKDLKKAGFARQVEKVVLHLTKKGVYESTSTLSNEKEYEIDYTNKLGASRQRLMDSNREIRKETREAYRLFNAVHEVNTEILKTLKDFDLSKHTKVHEKKLGGYQMVVQLSDLHIGNTIDIPGNKFNYEIAARRLSLFAQHIKLQCSAYDIKDITVAMTGDIINAASRLSKVMNNENNQAEITVQAAYLLKEFLLDLNSIANIAVTSIIGNEARVISGKDTNFYADANLVTNSFDYLTFKMVEMLLSGAKGITFLGGENYESVIEINGINLLLSHGDKLSMNPTAKLAGVIASYANKGIIIDQVLIGHYHSSFLANNAGEAGGIMRSSSLCGTDAYADSLHFSGGASQNILIIGENGSKLPMAIDLQNTDGIEGYSVLDIKDNPTEVKSTKTERYVKVII